MFELTKKEYSDLRSQIGTLKRGQHSEYAPMTFTEQGVAQLSTVINSGRAIQVNIQIIRLFTNMRKLLMTHKDLIIKLQKMENNLESQGNEIKLIFRYLKKLLQDQQEKNTLDTRKTD